MQVPEAIQWSECLARERPGRRVLLGLVVVALAIAVGLAAREWFVGALAAVGLAAVTAEGWAGCRCSIDGQGIVRAGPFRRRSLSWSTVERFTVQRSGTTLARAAGRGAISFHADGVPASDRARVQQALEAWHGWWLGSRTACGSVEP